MISFKKILTLTFALVLIAAFPLFSQEPVIVKRSDNKVVLEGKIYYVHVVKRGQTLYSIAKAYNVSEKEIVIENPGASAELLIGQVLKIPSDPSSAFDINTIEAVKGEKRHIIKSGETIYSISKKYKCTPEELISLNPDLDINNIPIGASINIPDDDAIRNELSFDEEGFIFHKVKRGETLSSISRYYRVSVGEIRSVNRELGWSGPRSGDVLRIPQPNTAVEVSFGKDTIKIAEVLIDSVNAIEMPHYTYDELTGSEPGTSKMYRVAYLIPFAFTELEPLDSLLKDVKSALRRERIKDEYIKEMETPQSVRLLEFLEGSLLAIDSLTDSGLNLDIHVYDTKRSMAETRKILEDPILKEMDLIIGPFYSYNLELVAAFSKSNRIPVVTPFYSGDSLLLVNPYLFQAVVSMKTEYEHNAEYIARSYDCNLILVHDGDSMNLLDIEYYKSALFRELEKYTDLESVLFKEVILGPDETEGLIHALNPDCKNLIILPATDEAFASRVASRIYYELQNFNIELFGSSYWAGFDDIEISYIHALNLKISLSYWNDYDDPAFLWFLNKYRRNYFKEPANTTWDGSNFGLAGYDISLYFLSALKQYGSRFILHLDDINSVNTLRKYKFRRISPFGGYSNTFLNYYYFNENLDVVKIDLPDIAPVHQFFQPAGDDPLYFKWSEPAADTVLVKDEQF